MLTLGLAGGLNAPSRMRYEFPWFFHDSAAALVLDGRLIEAAEEERLDRIKHSTCTPIQSVAACLSRAGAKLSDVERIGYYFTEEFLNAALQSYHLQRPSSRSYVPIRQHLEHAFESEFGESLGERLRFVPHHMAHAVSTYAMSGFDHSLVVVLDGMGDNVAVSVLEGRQGRLKLLDQLPASSSLGLYYLLVIHFLGYASFDEYKVMGLAPYGRPARYRSLFRSFYTLLPDGRFVIHRDRTLGTLHELFQPRRRGEPFLEWHHDLAAGLQESLEDIAFHVLRHWQKRTETAQLCLAGGVAHNCTLNGKVLYSGLFDQVFVQPASHDAGAAIGAAILSSIDDDTPVPVRSLSHVYVGSPLATNSTLEAEFARWNRFIRVEHHRDIVSETANRLVQGSVIGFVQSRAEFGPRALGHRSILADPRPSSNKHRINAMIKKREGYRPFAPSVLEEAVWDYFERPSGTAQLDFMTFVLRVRPEVREALGAVTHVDGTARVQTVSSGASPRYWKLIQAFGALTGVPMLLNTSFNNHAEPVVDSVRDAIVCFLTTGLDALVVGDFLIERKDYDLSEVAETTCSLPPFANLVHRIEHGGAETLFVENIHTGKQRAIAADTYRVLSQRRGTLRAALDAAQVGPERVAEVIEQVHELWSDRLVSLQPM